MGLGDEEGGETRRERKGVVMISTPFGRVGNSEVFEVGGLVGVVAGEALGGGNHKNVVLGIVAGFVAGGRIDPSIEGVDAGGLEVVAKVGLDEGGEFGLGEGDDVVVLI